MSDSKPTAASGPSRVGDAPAQASAPARWLERFSALLLVAATAVAVAAAAPALLQAAGTALPRLTPEPMDGAPLPLDLGHQPPELLANPDPLFDRDHDSDTDELPGALAEGRGRLGIARGPLPLRERPGEAGKLVAEVKAGELVMILRESGSYALVWAGGTDSVVKGWARRSGIAVR